LSGTSAIGSLTRLRAQCRGAKERLSTAAVTSLVADLPGHRSEVRLTRNELGEAIRAPLADFVGVVQETVERNGIRSADLVAVASVGGGARIPIVTTTLSEHFRVPVITTGQPELTAAIGGGLRAARGTADEGKTSMAAAAAAATAMAPGVAPQDAPVSSTFRALAWSDADDVPEVAPTDPYEYDAPANGGVTDARPQMQFDHEQYEPEAAPLPWYRKPAIILGAGVVALLAALVAAVLFVMRDDTTPSPASTTAPVTTTQTLTTTAAAPPPPAPAPPQTQAPQTETVTPQAPPPVTVTEAPPPTSEAPPPPPPTTEAPPPTTEAPPTSEPPPWSPTAPYPTIPGLPWVPAPQLPGQPAQP
jgi:cell division ATPase FtsA